MSVETRERTEGQVTGLSYESRKQQARRLLPASVEQVFATLFLSSWMATAQTTSCNTNIELSEWAKGDDGSMLRTLSFTRELGYRFGPKSTRVVQTQRCFFTGDGGAVLETSGHNLDVPFGDCFRVEGYIELFPSGEETAIVASVGLHFMESCMFRGRIENGAVRETKESYASMLDLASLQVRNELDETKAPPLLSN